MAKDDQIRKWSGVVSFAVISTPRRKVLVKAVNPNLAANSFEEKAPVDYIEIDNRGNGRTIWWAPNGQTASSAAQATFTTADGAILTLGAASRTPNFRVYPYEHQKIYVRATSISALSNTTGTTVFITTGRF